MHSIKPVLRIDKAKANGEAPLYIRIIKERKPTYKSLKFYLDPRHWDEKLTKVRKSHPNSVRLNHQISQKIAALSDAMLKLEDSPSPYHTAKVFNAVQGGKSIGLLEYAYTVLDRMDASSSIGTARRYKAVISKVSTYLNNKDIPIIDVTVKWLKDYETYLRRQMKNQTNTIASNMRVLRKIFNDADGEDLLPIGKNPFDKYAINSVSTEVEHFSEEELTAIMNVQLTPGTRIEQHRDLFIFACYAGGIRIGDLLKLKWKNFDGERIMLITSKTKEPVSIKLAGVPLDIISRQTTERDTGRVHIRFIAGQPGHGKQKGCT
jgi:integrase/recombinase XerD